MAPRMIIQTLEKSGFRTCLKGFCGLFKLQSALSDEEMAVIVENMYKCIDSFFKPVRPSYCLPTQNTHQLVRKYGRAPLIWRDEK